MQKYLPNNCDRTNFSNANFLHFIFNLKCILFPILLSKTIEGSPRLSTSMKYVDNEAML